MALNTIPLVNPSGVIYPPGNINTPNYLPGMYQGQANSLNSLNALAQSAGNAPQVESVPTAQATKAVAGNGRLYQPMKTVGNALARGAKSVRGMIPALPTGALGTLARGMGTVGVAGAYADHMLDKQKENPEFYRDLVANEDPETVELFNNLGLKNHYSGSQINIAPKSPSDEVAPSTPAPTAAGLMDESYGQNLASGTATTTPTSSSKTSAQNTKKTGSSKKTQVPNVGVSPQNSGITSASYLREYAPRLPTRSGDSSSGLHFGGNNLDFLNDLLPLLAAGGLGYMLAK